MILFRKDQRTAREPEPDQTEPDQQEGRGAAGDRGAFNLEWACYFRYCLNVVCFYTDLKMKILKMKAESVQKPKGGH